MKFLALILSYCVVAVASQSAYYYPPSPAAYYTPPAPPPPPTLPVPLSWYTPPPGQYGQPAIRIDFNAQTFAQWNPRHNGSLTAFSTENDVLQDRALFLAEPDNGIAILTLPFTAAFPTPVPPPTTVTHEYLLSLSNQRESDLVIGGLIHVGKDAMLTVSTQLACHTYNVAQHPFPADLVLNADNDFRLANCGIFLDFNEVAEYHFILTNRCLFAAYVAIPISEVAEITSVRAYTRLITCVSSQTSSSSYGSTQYSTSGKNQLIPFSLALQYDSSKQVVNYIASGQIVWTVKKFGGYLTADDGAQLVFQSVGPKGVDWPANNRTDNWLVNLYNGKALMLADPNRQQDTWGKLPLKALVNMQPLDTTGTMTYWDKNDRHKNVVFGQGAITHVKYIEVATSGSNYEQAPATGRRR